MNGYLLLCVVLVLMAILEWLFTPPSDGTGGR